MPNFLVEHEGNTYSFRFGSQTYIFDYGVYHEIDKKYGIKTLLQFVYFVDNCYSKDSNATPLGSLTDFVADSWKEMQHLSAYEVLDKFYLEGNT